MKELIEAAEKYRRDTCNEACKQGFLDNNPSPSIKSAFIAGGEWMREQMMKEAVEGEVESFSNMEFPEVSVPLNPAYFKPGDKVKLIIIKED